MRRMAWLVAAALAAAACSGSSGPSAPPNLINVFWIAGGQRTLVWTTTQPDGGLAVLAPPAVQQIDFVFDQRLDGNKIENAATPPIAVSWPDQGSSPATFTAQVLYNSEPFYMGTSSYAFVRPATAGLPSSDSITFALNKALLTGTGGQPFVGPDQVTVMTGPLVASVRLPSNADAGGAVPASYMVPIAFTNRVSADGVGPYIHASTASDSLPVSVAADASDPTVVYVTAACAGGWPIGQAVTVTIDSRAPDAFGGLLADPASGTFTAAGAGGGPADGGC